MSCVVVLCLPKGDGAAASGEGAGGPEVRPGMEGFMDALAAVFSPATDAGMKMRALESQLGPEAAGRLKGDVKRMGSLEDYAIEIGVERGRKEEHEKTSLDYIANLMESLSISADEAFRMLKVPKDEQKEYRTKLTL